MRVVVGRVERARRAGVGAAAVDTISREVEVWLPPISHKEGVLCMVPCGDSCARAGETHTRHRQLYWELWARSGAAFD